MRSRLSTMFASLSVPNFRYFTLGQLIKMVAVWMQFTAQGWLVLELTGDSASALGTLTALQFAPALLFSLYGGKLADRYDKRRLLIWLNSAVSVLALALGILVATGAVTLMWVYFFAATTGIANAMENPVRQAFVSEMVSRRLLPNALSLSAATFNMARIVGPAVGGAAIALVGMGPIFLLNAATYLAPAVALARMRTGELYREESLAAPGGVRDGLLYVWRRSDLMLPLVLLLVLGMIGFNFSLTLPVLAKVVFGTGPEQFGILMTTLAIGSLIGALASSPRRDRPTAYVVIGAAAGFGLLYTLCGLMPSFWTTAAMLAPAGFFMTFFAQAGNQRIQIGTDAAYRGRVMAIWSLFFLGTTPIGGPLIGYVAEHLGARLSIWAGGLICLATGLVALVWQLRRSGARLRVRLRPVPAFYVTPAEAAEPEPAATAS